MANNSYFEEIDCYLYISHLDGELCDVNKDPKFWKLPQYPDSVSDSKTATFQSVTALGRSAPVFTFSGSAERTVAISLNFPRDLMEEINTGSSNVRLDYKDTYTDALIRALQSIALPKYNLTNTAVEPPLVALKIGREIFIKGIVSSPIGLTYSKPILYNDKYGQVTISFTVTETDPYDSSSVFKQGGFRGVVNSLRRGMNISEGE